MPGPIHAGNILVLVVVDSINICNDENDDVDVLIVLMVLTCGKSGVNICRARVAETGELEETPIQLEVPLGTMHYISLYISLYNISVYIYIFCSRCQPALFTISYYT